MIKIVFPQLSTEMIWNLGKVDNKYNVTNLKHFCLSVFINIKINTIARF